MANARTTKRALFASVLSLILCCAMLIGSTFAWFTDSVTTGANKIVAGNLDISAEVFDPEAWDDEAIACDSYMTLSPEFFNGGLGDSDIIIGFPEEGTDLKDYTSFFTDSEDSPLEPGKAVLKLLRIYNNGDLAVKLSLHFDVEDGGLQDALWFSVNWTSNVSFYDDNDKPAQDGQKSAVPMSQLNSTLSDVEIVILPMGENGSQGYQDVYFAFGMDKDADTKYQGKSFNAALSILATQYTYESDSFDNQYDAMAFDDMMAEMNPLRVDMSISAESDDMGIVTFDTSNSKLIQVYTNFIYPESKTTFIFTVTGVAAETTTLTFDFGEKCGADENYKGVDFEYGFGGYEDIYLSRGTYEVPSWEEFTLTGEYHPFVVTVTPGAGNNNSFSYQGPLEGLIDKLQADAFTLEAGVEYNDTFTVTVEWPLSTYPTETCYETVDGEKYEDGMDHSDTYLSCAANQEVDWEDDYGCLDLWADFEVMFNPAG